MPAAPSRRLGTWKLAYADFLTALVAFFIVMWLVKGFPEDGRADVAGYFRDDAAAASLVTSAPERLADRIADSLSSHEVFRRHASALQVVADGDRIRIDLSDRTSAPVFATGDRAFTTYGTEMLSELSALVADSPWPIEIEGHTDAFPFAGDSGSNWSLSVQRAEEARLVLEDAGVSASRIEAVTGRADTLPLNPGEPHHPSNRRITIILKVAQ